MRFELRRCSGYGNRLQSEVGRAPSIQDLQPAISGEGMISGKSASIIVDSGGDSLLGNRDAFF